MYIYISNDLCNTYYIIYINIYYTWTKPFVGPIHWGKKTICKLRILGARQFVTSELENRRSGDGVAVAPGRCKEWSLMLVAWFRDITAKKNSDILCD